MCLIFHTGRANFSSLITDLLPAVHFFMIFFFTTGEITMFRIFPRRKTTASNIQKSLWPMPENILCLNEIEEDIIRKHMWPLTLVPPKYKESFIVSSRIPISLPRNSSATLSAIKPLKREKKQADKT